MVKYGNNSLYRREDYKYPFFIAYIMQLDVYFGGNLGKIVFSICDAYNINIAYDPRNEVSYAFSIVNFLSAAIASRGSADSVHNMFLVRAAMNNYADNDIMISSFILLGVATFLRLYPIILLPIFVLDMVKRKRNSSSMKLMTLLPVLSFLVTLIMLMCIAYLFFGQELYFENAIQFHLTKRSDTQHNFSPWFYVLLLESSNETTLMIVKVFQVLSILIIALKHFYEQGPYQYIFFKNLFMTMLCFVTFNSVITAQYFTWFGCFLPLIMMLPNREKEKEKESQGKLLVALCIFLVGMTAWLAVAYLLEFRGLVHMHHAYIASVFFILCSVTSLSYLS